MHGARRLAAHRSISGSATLPACISGCAFSLFQENYANCCCEESDSGQGHVVVGAEGVTRVQQQIDAAHERAKLESRAGTELTAAVSDAVPIPVIASGGAGTFEHFRDVFTAGRADAALAASIFHFNEKSVSELKHYLRSHDIAVRL